MAALVLARRSLFQSTLSVRRATKERVALAVRKPFQSTLSVRRATAFRFAPYDATQFQSTLSVRRATLAPEKAGGKHVISIHALREESDRGETFTMVRPSHFNPRSP